MRWPSVKDVAADLRFISKQPLGPECADEDGEIRIDVRLQVVPGEGWHVWEGQSCYDTDHRGYWGSSCVPANGKRFNARNVARELIAEARDAWAQDQA